MRIPEPIKVSGYFWLPGKSDQRLPGVLHVSEAGKITLEVVGVFGDAIALLTGSSPDLPRVVGVVENGDPVTLEDCFYANTNVSFGGLHKSTISASLFLRGVQYGEGEPILFSKVSFSLEGLDEWLSVTGLRVDYNWEEKNRINSLQPTEEYCMPAS